MLSRATYLLRTGLPLCGVASTPMGFRDDGSIRVQHADEALMCREVPLPLWCLVKDLVLAFYPDAYLRFSGCKGVETFAWR